jgi:CRISPR-associated protein Csh1
MNVAIRDQTERILADLEEKFSQKKSKDNAIITLGIERGEEICYPRDLQVFRNISLKKGSEVFSNKYGGESKGDDALCSVCKEMNDEVYSFAIPWSFHTLTSPASSLVVSTFLSLGKTPQYASIAPFDYY